MHNNVAVLMHAFASSGRGRRLSVALFLLPLPAFPQLLTLSNGKVSIVLSATGGRLVQFTDAATGTAHLGGGGIWDKEGIWPTTNISNYPFQPQVTAIEATFRAEIGNLRITHSYRLDPGSARLDVQNRYQNIGPEPIRCLFSEVFTLPPNPIPVLYPEGGGITRRTSGAALFDPRWWQAGDLRVEAKASRWLAEAAVSFPRGQARVELHTRRGLLTPGDEEQLDWSLGLVPPVPDFGEHYVPFPWGALSVTCPDPVMILAGTLPVETRLLGKPPNRLGVRLQVDSHPIPADVWKLPDGPHALSIQAGGHELRLQIATLHPARLLQRLDRDRKRAERLDCPSCEMRVEDAYRKFALGPGFNEGSINGRAIAAASLPRVPDSRVTPSDVAYVLRVLAEAEGWMDELARGGDPFCNLHGLFQRAFRSRADATLQPYAIYVPPGYDRRTPLPLLLLLHGAGGDQWEIPQSAANLDGRSPYAGAYERQIQQPGFILASPLARGASRYEGLGESDTLQMLDEIEHAYAIDRDRVYIMGWSMGGIGAWSLAERFPKRFAAIMPIAGYTDIAQMAKVGPIAIWSFNGLADTVVHPQHLLEIEDAASRLHLDHHDGLREHPFIFGPQTDHWAGYRMAGSWKQIESILARDRR
jgi:predicted esterase